MAAGPVSRIRRTALQTDKLFEISSRSVNDVNFGSDGRFCVTPASQLWLWLDRERRAWVTSGLPVISGFVFSMLQLGLNLSE